jgi:hypothetical protein
MSVGTFERLFATTGSKPDANRICTKLHGVAAVSPDLRHPERAVLGSSADSQARVVLRSSLVFIVTLIRRLARSVCLVPLLALAVPAGIVPCDAETISAHDAIPCCAKTPASSSVVRFDADCCTVREQIPSSRSTMPATSARSSPFSVTPAVVAATSGAVYPSRALRPLASSPGPPPLRLYLRLSALRR